RRGQTFRGREALQEGHRPLRGRSARADLRTAPFRRGVDGFPVAGAPRPALRAGDPGAPHTSCRAWETRGQRTVSPAPQRVGRSDIANNGAAMLSSSSVLGARGAAAWTSRTRPKYVTR